MSHTCMLGSHHLTSILSTLSDVFSAHTQGDDQMHSSPDQQACALADAMAPNQPAQGQSNAKRSCSGLAWEDATVDSSASKVERVQQCIDADEQHEQPLPMQPRPDSSMRIQRLQCSAHPATLQSQCCPLFISQCRLSLCQG